MRTRIHHGNSHRRGPLAIPRRTAALVIGILGLGGSDAFAFVSSRTSGNAVTILDFASDDTIYLTGYGTNDAATALSNATAVGGNTTITLTDHTQVTFIGVGSASTLQGHVFSF